jgi:hypothetical protein
VLLLPLGGKAGRRTQWPQPQLFRAVGRSKSVNIVGQEDGRSVRVAELGGAADDRVKHGLRIRLGLRDGAQNLARRGLLVERRRQLAICLVATSYVIAFGPLWLSLGATSWGKSGRDSPSCRSIRQRPSRSGRVPRSLGSQTAYPQHISTLSPSTPSPSA